MSSGGRASSLKKDGVRCVKDYNVNTLTSIFVSLCYNGRLPAKHFRASLHGLLVRSAKCRELQRDTRYIREKSLLLAFVPLHSLL